MRLLMISWEYPPFVVGGMGKHVAELLPALAKQTGSPTPLQIDLLTTRSAGGATVERFSRNVTIYRVDVPPIDPNDLFNSVLQGNRTLQERAERLAQQNRYQVIHVHDWLAASAGIALKHLWRVPLVVTMHATERGRHQSHLPNLMSQQINQLEWKVCFEAWRVIACSGFMAGELHGYFSIPLDKISVIPNGVDQTPFQQCTADQVESLRSRYAPDGETLLFFVGRITPEKGVHVLLNAMPAIVKEDEHVRLLVAGKNSEQMQPLVDELGVADHVELLGFIDDATRNCLYAAVDAAIFPSLYEPFGIVALEAMAADCSVIVSDVGGLPEVVHHLHNGLTVFANNSDSIAWAVDYLRQHPAEAHKWRQKALGQVQSRFTWENIAQRTSELYRIVVAERATVDW